MSFQKWASVQTAEGGSQERTPGRSVPGGEDRRTGRRLANRSRGRGTEAWRQERMQHLQGLASHLKFKGD